MKKIFPVITLEDIRTKVGEPFKVLYENTKAEGDSYTAQDTDFTPKGAPLGMLIQRDSDDKVPCYEKGCGWWGFHLSGHVRRHHRISADEYKQKWGFNKKTSLCSTVMSQTLRENALKYGHRIQKGEEARKMAQKSIAARRKEKVMPIERANHFNACPAQIQALLQNLVKAYGEKALTYKLVRAKAPKIINYAHYHYKTFNRFKKAFNLYFHGQGAEKQEYRISDAALKEAIRGYVDENRKLPFRDNKKADNRFPYSMDTYVKRFGSKSKSWVVCGIVKYPTGFRQYEWQLT